MVPRGSTFILGAITVLTFASTLVAAQQTLPPWIFQTMYWGWSSDQNNTWTQCRSLELQWWQIPDTTPAIKAPFTATFFLAGHEPFKVDLGSGSPKAKVLTYEWPVVLPSGGPYQATLTDANGATAGDIQYIYVVAESPPVTPCTVATLTPSTLDLQTSGDLTQCANLNVTVTGGTPPYTFTTVQQDIQFKQSSYATGTFVYVLDIAAGLNVSFAVTDSTGKGVVGPFFNVGQSTNTACLKLAQTFNPLAAELTSVYPGTTFALVSPSSTTASPAATTTNSAAVHHKTPTSAIVGGAVAAVLLILFAGIFGACWQRRKAKRQQPGVDLGESHVPASEPAQGMQPPRPFLLEDLPQMAGYTQFVPYGRTAASYHEEQELLGASPPYTPSADSKYTPTTAKSRGSPPQSAGDRRFSINSDVKSDSEFLSPSSRRSSDQDLRGSASGSAAGRWSGLPPGAGAPSPPPIQQTYGGPLYGQGGGSSQTGLMRPASSQSPPPTYPTYMGGSNTGKRRE